MLIVLTPVSPCEAALRRFGKFPRQSTRYLTFSDNCFLRPTCNHPSTLSTAHHASQPRHRTSSRETFLGYGLGRLCRNETRRLVASTTVMLAPRSVLITSREDLFHRGRHPIASHSPRLASSIIADCEEKELLGRKEGRKHCCKSLVIGFRELKIHIRKICGKMSTSRIKFCWSKP